MYGKYYKCVAINSNNKKNFLDNNWAKSKKDILYTD